MMYSAVNEVIPYQILPEIDSVGTDAFFLLQNWVVRQMPNLEFDEDLKFEYLMYKEDCYEPMQLGGYTIYPQIATIEMYIYFLYFEVTINQEDLTIDACFEMISQ